MLEPLFNKAEDLKACIFIKKETPIQVFCCEYCEIFKIGFFFVEHFTVHYTFPKFYVMIKFFGHLRAQKTDIFHIFFAIAWISLMVHDYSVLVFIPKFLVSVTFASITTSAPAVF